ncbi:hypothetical protein [Sulfurisoma sediminicola]|uniref:Formylmethanofuran dehydrogenase subunit E n=1 Tax=Sulfurisoma sediminicola TaxID=1381557 RepID=A0A497X8Z7_9PROT|nr:hypothetical protein [Sulfurisoma sediminicola]RLJ62712.1 hypothetical protein DFR35_2528 [Sulfurisoma sediminicola]
MNPSQFPDFFAAAPPIPVVDPLAEFLGAAAGGLIEYRYADAVRLAGHSCPTVAAAFLMTRAALKALYPEALPERGNLRVDFREPRDAGVTGVMAAVATLITGATEDSGFRGIGGHFNRRDRLFFGQALAAGDVRYTRLDGGAAVEAAARLDRVPGDPRTSRLMSLCLIGAASPAETSEFRELWQGRVRRLLLDHADDPEVICVFPQP